MFHLNASHLAVAALTAALASAPASAQTELLDDFASGNDSTWTHVDLLAANKLGRTIYDASSKRYRLASSINLPPLPVAAATLSYVTKTPLAPRYANGRLRVTIRFDTTATNAGVLVRGDAQRLNGYGFSMNNHENRIFIDRLVGGQSTRGGIGGVTTAPFQIKENTDYILEVAALDDELTMKVWESGTTPPWSPQLRATDKRYTSGGLGVYIYNQSSAFGGMGGSLSAQFDDVHFTPCATMTSYGSGCPGSSGVPSLRVVGCATGGERVFLSVRDGAPRAVSVTMIGTARARVVAPCTLLVDNILTAIPLVLSPVGAGAVRLWIPSMPVLKGIVTFQAIVVDPKSSFGLSASAGVELHFR